MITIEQFIESIVLDFEPRWVAKDQDGEVSVYGTRPSIEADEKFWSSGSDKWQNFGIIKLTEFENCPWEECLYEVPQTTTDSKKELVGKIEKLPEFDRTEASIFHAERLYSVVNELVDAVNKHADIIQQIGDWGTSKGECLWCETIDKA